MSTEPLTEIQVMKALDRLAKRWPRHLELFSWSGSLHLVDMEMNRELLGETASISRRAIVAEYGSSIRNGGGDPDERD